MPKQEGRKRKNPHKAQIIVNIVDIMMRITYIGKYIDLGSP